MGAATGVFWAAAAEVALLIGLATFGGHSAAYCAVVSLLNLWILFGHGFLSLIAGAANAALVAGAIAAI